MTRKDTLSVGNLGKTIRKTIRITIRINFAYKYPEIVEFIANFHI